MKIIEFIRLILKHLRLLIIVPLLLACLVILLTSKPSFEFSSQTILYTGLATGSSIEMDKKFNYFSTNIAFENLVNVINSRDTQEEVGIRLLALHLMLPEANPKYISRKLFDEFKLKIPEGLYDYVEKGDKDYSDLISQELSDTSINLFPDEIDRGNYEKTVENLTNLMKSSNDNFVYELLNYEDEHYSLKALSGLKAQRINTSDLFKLSYTVNDPGICQQTLAIYNEVCIKNYKNIKGNRSDAVVKYFENQLALASLELEKAEEKLLNFNKNYKIINYYEQSKAVAFSKENMEFNYNKNQAELAGRMAAAKKIEEKLDIQKQIRLINNDVIDKKKKLGDLNFEITLMEDVVTSQNNEEDISKLKALKKKHEDLTKSISSGINQIYSFENTVEGVPLNTSLPEWMDNVVQAENLRANIRVKDEQNRKFQEQYAIYAPAGATIKRIEREINVSEQGYLEILHGLNLAKLKMQDNELSANLKAMDPPFYPISPIPTKRKILIIAAAFIGGIIVLGIILAMEYFDNTLRNSNKAKKILDLGSLGMMPKIVSNPGKINLEYIQNRLIEVLIQNVKHFISTHPTDNHVKTVVMFSTQKIEGKTVLGGNMAKTLKKEGKKVLLFNYSREQKVIKQQRKFPIVNRILGYPDPRIDFENPFLSDVSSYLNNDEYHKYSLNESFYKVKDYKDIMKQNDINLDYTPDYVIIELPALIYNNYPSGLIANADINILTCRANRTWSEADRSVVDNLLEISPSRINFIVNGVEVNEIESVLGELPKKRSKLRKKMKTAFRFQFFNKNQI